MKRALKKNSSIFAYLDSLKVLETGSEQDIIRARKEYWKKYSAEWRNRQRKQLKHYMIDFTPSEARLVIDAAKKHKMSTTAFVKKSCFGYMNKRYLVQDAYSVNEISQLLAMNYNALQNLIDENVIQHQAGQVMLKQLSTLEERVNASLRYPKTLEELVVDTVQANPRYLETLESLLKNLKL